MPCNMLLPFLLIDNQKAECMRLDGTIEEQIEDLKADFANIVTDTQVCLEDRYSNPKYARSWLNEILRGTKDEPLVIEESASDYFLQLQNKWSFTNPTLLQQLADKLKNALLKGKMQDYKRKFDEFCHSFPINNETAAKPVEFELCDPRQPCLVLIFESVSKFYDIEVFLTDVFDIYKRYLRVHKIELGSIQTVTVQFAASMEPHFQACIDQNRETARRHNVTDMHIEPQTGLKPTAPDTTATEDQTHEAVDTLDGKIQNMTRTPETRSRKRAYSAPNGTNKKNKASKLANGEMTPA